MEVGSDNWIALGFCIALLNTYFLFDNIKQHKKNPKFSNKVYIALSAVTGPVLAVYLIGQYIL